MTKHDKLTLASWVVNVLLILAMLFVMGRANSRLEHCQEYVQQLEAE